MNDLLSIPQAAAHIGASKSFLQKKCRSGELPSWRVGNEYRIRLSDLEGLIKGHQSGDKNCKQPSPAHLNSILPLLNSWVAYLTNVQALSPKTIQTYQWMLRNYLKKLAELDQELTPDLLFEVRTRPAPSCDGAESLLG